MNLNKWKLLRCLATKAYKRLTATRTARLQAQLRAISDFVDSFEAQLSTRVDVLEADLDRLRENALREVGWMKDNLQQHCHSRYERQLSNLEADLDRLARELQDHEAKETH